MNVFYWLILGMWLGATLVAALGTIIIYYTERDDCDCPCTCPE